MRTGTQAVSMRQSINLDEFGHAAAPACVGLQDMMQAPPDDVAEPDRRELVLATGDRNRALARQLRVTIEIVR